MRLLGRDEKKEKVKRRKKILRKDQRPEGLLDLVT
jgi:hypothetical protein